MVEAFINTIIDAVGDINIETWIGKNDFLLYKMKFEKMINLNQIYPGVSDTQIKLSFNLTNSNFNDPIVVQEPQGAQKIEDAFSSLIVGQKIKALMGQLSSTVYSIYSEKKSYASICSKGLLNGYLEMYGGNLIDLNNSIVAEGGKKPACFSNVNNICISTQLPDGNYSCVGKNLIVGETKCLSATTICR